ncbi:molecular chaperone DnaJ [Mycoplasmopsis cricetuli]|uniref:molecular chaperone DnaJ n=1 Tax=Mycoplasmopsis cricetuli TaxID=171283 RepID=UPI000471D700|nr:molecular chaperone DnaJ [Mycoplasmopsis cricetuli]
MARKRDYYEVLGVSKTATEKEIKTAYRKLAMKYHPDRSKEPDAEKKMQEVNEAYEILSNSEKRQMYDQYGHDGANANFSSQGFNGFSGFGGFENIFQDIFSGFGGSSRRRKGPIKGEDKEHNYFINFIDSFNGLSETRKFPKYDLCLFCGGTGADKADGFHTCNTCNGRGSVTKQIKSFFGSQIVTAQCETCEGTGKIITKKCSNCKGHRYIKTEKEIKINIPAGIKEGTVLRCAGYGEPGYNGGQPGDLYLHIRVREHKFFKRHGEDLILDFPVSFADIMQENTIEVPTPNSTIKIKLKKSYLESKVINLSGEGFSHNSRKGNMKLNLKIIIPDYSSKQRKELLKVLETIEDTTNKDFVSKVKRSS